MNKPVESHTHRVYNDMYGELQTMQCERDAAWARYEALNSDCAVMETAVGVMKRRAARGQGATSATMTSKDIFDGCKNAQQRLIRLAEEWGGVVDCREAANLLISMGISTSGKTNLVPALQSEMAEKPELWELISPRTYRYLPYGEAGGKGTINSNGEVKNNFL